MLTVIKKRLMRKQLGIKQFDDDDRDDVPTFTPPASYIKLAQGKILLESRALEHDVSESTCVKEKDDMLAFSPSAKYIKLAQGKIVLESSTPTEPMETFDSSAINRDKQQASLEKRLVEVETTLQRLQEYFNTHCTSPTFEKELREQLENMNRVLKAKERKQTQTCRDHKALQTRFARQENLLHVMQQENKALLLRIKQYEHCLDDVMRKVVDAIVAEDNLRLEVAMLKSRVRDLEAQNAALTASPAKGRDEGYCTMSSGQPQPSNGHLEDLPEEPEQWLLPAEPCSTEMEDWSMSQEELVLNNLDDNQQTQSQQQQQQQNKQQQQQVRVQDDWIWNSQDFLNSTTVETDSVTDGISQLLQQKIIYSEDEEMACTEFTDDFYKLVNIRSSSARSLYSYPEDATDDEDDDDDDDDDDELLHNDDKNINGRVSVGKVASPTPSEAGRAQLSSCSSSTETDENSRCALTQQQQQQHQIQNQHKITDDVLNEKASQEADNEPTYCVIADAEATTSGNSSGISTASVANETQTNERNLPRLGSSWRRSHGWRRVTHTSTVGALVSPKKETTTKIKFNYTQPVHKVPPTRIPTCITFPQQLQHQPTTVRITTQQQQQQQQQQTRKSKIPPPVPVRRSYSYAS